MKASEAIDDLAMLQFATRETLARHIKHVQQVVRKDSANRALLESINAHEQNLNQLLPLIDQILGLIGESSVKTAIMMAQFGREEGARLAIAERDIKISEQNRRNVQHRHDTRKKAYSQLKSLWGSGNFTSTHDCAYQEHEALNLTFNEAYTYLEKLQKSEKRVKPTE